ncbi:MAG: SMI1/KNR4 family protein [Planctomycetota bacterium]|nr:MAG: SMI1/KNR4 family protein [Planctomycetota bacterium]
MGDEFLQTIEDHLWKRQVASPGSIRGCSEEEIREIRQRLGHLPAAYVAFLRRMGRGAGEWFLGSDVFYPTCLELNAWAAETLAEESNPPQLPEDAVVFGMHQGYQFHFMVSSEGDDPPVYYYHEGGEGFERVADSFSTLMIKCATGVP